MNKRTRFLFVFLLLSSSASYADPLTELQLLDAALEQIKQTKALKGELESQVKLLESGNKAMTGHYNYSSLFKNEALASWQKSGADWSSFLDDKGSSPISSFKKQIEQEFPLKSSASLFSLPNSEQAKLYDLLAKTTLASRASNMLAYNSINEELAMLEKLQQQIEESPNQKATLDLIARIQIEEAKLIAYQVKSQAASSQLTSLQSQQEVSDAKWMGDFFKWHD